MGKVESVVLPEAADENSWFKALKTFLSKLKEEFPAFKSAVGLKTFARGYVTTLRKKWENALKQSTKNTWEYCHRKNGCRRCSGSVGG